MAIQGALKGKKKLVSIIMAILLAVSAYLVGDADFGQMANGVGAAIAGDDNTPPAPAAATEPQPSPDQ